MAHATIHLRRNRSAIQPRRNGRTQNYSPQSKSVVHYDHDTVDLLCHCRTLHSRRNQSMGWAPFCFLSLQSSSPFNDSFHFPSILISSTPCLFNLYSFYTLNLSTSLSLSPPPPCIAARVPLPSALLISVSIYTSRWRNHDVCAHDSHHLDLTFRKIRTDRSSYFSLGVSSFARTLRRSRCTSPSTSSVSHTFSPRFGVNRPFIQSTIKLTAPFFCRSHQVIQANWDSALCPGPTHRQQSRDHLQDPSPAPPRRRDLIQECRDLQHGKFTSPTQFNRIS
jgi:hypothetical protein